MLALSTVRQILCTVERSIVEMKDILFAHLHDDALILITSGLLSQIAREPSTTPPLPCKLTTSTPAFLGSR